MDKVCRTGSYREYGFTLVELVTVLLILGVLSVLGIGVFAERSGFTPLLAKQQLASAASLAQQGALAGTPGDSMTISQTSGEITFTVGPGTVSEKTFSLVSEGVTFSGPPQLAFEKNGSLASGANRELTFSGNDISYTTCISSLGAVYRGSCQP